MTQTAANILPDQLDLDELNGLFEASDPEKIVAWSAARFGQDLVMTSSFGAESALLLHMVTRALPRIRVIMVNTGYLFPETWQHMEALRRRLDLNVWVYRTRNDPIAWLRTAGEENPAFRKDHDACCAANKNEPMERAMKDLAPRAWLRGIRRNQITGLPGRPYCRLGRALQLGAMRRPLLNWSTREIFAYMKKHDLPYHPLYEKGYVSIGCNPLSCTRAIQAGEDDRAGRWAGTNKVECGINLTNSLDSSHL